jgi:D-glycero-D-manno-heptose 1,7-bisphosphate phosphatase
MSAVWGVFLDRDGVINEETHYLSHPEQLHLLPGAAEAIRRLNECSIPVIVVTNQAGVARGYFTETEVDAVHARLADMLEQRGARVDRFYYCPHHPTAGSYPYRLVCDCRKPQPGMLIRAARECGLHLPSSYIIGDQVSDLEAGRRVACRTILVRTGYGERSWAEWSETFQPDYVAAHLLDAVEWILAS